MSKSKSDLIIDSRYIHTGNSGVTISIERDAKRPTRASLRIHNGSMCAFTTDMEIRGNDYNGMTAIQLRDLALVFLEGANALDQIQAGQDPTYEGYHDPSLVHDNVEAGGHDGGTLSVHLRNHLQTKFTETGMDKGSAYTATEDLLKSMESEVGCTSKEASVLYVDAGGQPMTESNIEQFKKSLSKIQSKAKKKFDKAALIKDRLRFLTK